MAKVSNNVSKEEIDKKVQEMIAERQRQDVESYEKIFGSAKSFFKRHIGKPISKEEMDNKMQEMIAERQQQDAEALIKYQI